MAWAVVRRYEKQVRRAPGPPPERAVAELVRIAGRRSLIVVNRAEFWRLPGVAIVPVSASPGLPGARVRPWHERATALAQTQAGVGFSAEEPVRSPMLV